MRYDNFIRGARQHSRGRLPHWETDDADYFVTFRLRDSLPAQIARQLLIERGHQVQTAQTDAERVAIDQAFGRRLDSYLDAGYGSCVLREHGALLADAIRHFDGDRYRLHA